MSEATLNWADITVVAVYFVLIAVISASVSLRRRWKQTAESEDEQGAHSDSKEAEDFFLASRNTSWLGVGCSLFMSNIGSEHFVALAGSGASSGIAVANFEWLASVTITLVLGYLFVPFYLSTRIRTVPEFLSVRFSRPARMYIAVITVFTGVVVKICVTLYSGALVLRVLFGWNTYLSLLILVLGTAVYTVVGGLSAVIYTEVLQTFVLLLGGLPLMFLTLREVGGWNALVDTTVEESPDRAWMFHLLQPLNGPEWVTFPWTGIVLGLPAMEVFYWCTDQVQTQRVLAAKSIAHAKGGCVLTAFVKLLIPPIMVLPGICARALFDEVKEEPNTAFPLVVSHILPHGLLGLMLAAMLAALMSSLASTYNSTSAIISYEFYKRMRPRATEKTLVAVGRISIVALTVIAILWVPIVNVVSSSLYVYIQSVISYVAPPIAVVYLAGIIWKRATPRAAVATLYIGGFVGFARFVAETIMRSSGIVTDNELIELAVYSNFLHFAFFSTCLSVVVLVIVSLFTEPTHQAKIDAVFAHARKADELATFSVIEESFNDALETAQHSIDSDSEHEGPEEIVHRLHFAPSTSGRLMVLGNEAQKVLINTAASIQSGLAASIFWHFR